MSNYHQPDASGHFGPYGGSFVAETLVHALDELKRCYAEVQNDPGVQTLPDGTAASVVDLHRLRPSHPSDSRNDLSQVVYVAPVLVLCDLFDVEHAVRCVR